MQNDHNQYNIPDKSQKVSGVNPPSWYRGYLNAQRVFFQDNVKSTRTRLKKMGILDLPRVCRILDFGCGDGNLIHFLQSEGFYNVVGVEPDIRLVCEARSTGKAVAGIGENLPFKNRSFDTIISMAVLHHLRDYKALKRTMEEFIRLLRPGGLFCYCEPAETLSRSLLTLLLLSPVGLLTKFSRQKRKMVIAEQKTLNKWLKIEQRFPGSVMVPLGFHITFLERRALKTYLQAIKFAGY